MDDPEADDKTPSGNAWTERDWAFTFGHGQPFEGHFVRFQGTYAEARKQMVEAFRHKWANQYPASRFERISAGWQHKELLACSHCRQTGIEPGTFVEATPFELGYGEPCSCCEGAKWVPEDYECKP